jgi:hypothetical protein
VKRSWGEPPPDEGVVPAHEGTAGLGDEAGQEGLERAPQGQFDDVAVREEVHEEGLDGGEVRGSSQIEEQDADRRLALRADAHPQIVREKTGLSAVLARK